MNLALNLGDSTISSDRVIDQLHRFGLFDQLLQEINIDYLIEEMAKNWSIDLNYTSIEFDEKYIEIDQGYVFQGMNTSQLEAICDREVRLQKFKLAKWGDDIDVYFQVQGEGLDRLTLSVLQVQNAPIAQELFFRIQSAESSFAEIALDYSQGIHADNGGILGPLLLRDLKPELVTILCQLQPGDFSPLFRLDNYYTFVRLDERRSAELDDTMRQFILNELFSNWLRSRILMRLDG